MRRLSVGTALLLAAFVGVPGLGCSPLTPPGFECGSAGACNEQSNGECVAGVGGSFCAYANTACNGEDQTGYSWGPAAGANSGCLTAPPNIDRDAGPIDAQGSSGPGSGSGNPCFGNPTTFRVCLTPTEAETVRSFPPAGSNHIYSGGQGGSDQITSTCDFSVVQDGLNFCVVGGSAMTFDEETYIEDPAGDHPIVFVSSDTITISAALIADGSLSNKNPGPGSLLGSACTASAGSTGNQTGGGGAGGTYATTGGNGGEGGQGANGGQASTTLTASGAMILPGCWGGTGGEVDGGGDGGDFLPDGQQISNPGGYSGGIVYFIAKNGITVTNSGYIDVGGGGGAGGGDQSVGGGGGGTGGFVGMDAPTIMMMGFVYARGGAGGGGADQDKQERIGPIIYDQPQDGGQGDDGSASQAQGGKGGGNGGGGGNGPNNAGDNGGTGTGGKSNSQGGGGGGGGGNGVIWTIGGTAPPGQLIGTVYAQTIP